MALEAVGRETFVVEVFTDGLAVEAVDLTIDKTWFEDGSEWRRAQEARLVDYKPNELPPNRRLEQLRYIAGSDAVGYPSDQGNVWICVCGRVNAAEEKACRRCSRDQDMVFERFSFEAVQRENDRRERELEQKARLAREEASQKEFLRQTQAKRKRRIRRIRTAVICASIVISGVAYVFVVLGLPEIRYQTALSSLSSGDPERAKQGFIELATYRNSASMVDACDLDIATNYVNTGDMEKIEQGIALFEELGDFDGAKEGILLGNYQKAMVLMDAKDYESASNVLEPLQDYRDAQALYNQSEYELASRELDAKEYETARARFLSLGPKYSDALARANDCIYLPAKELMLAEKYDEAAELFDTIQGYSDASKQWQQCVYLSASRAHLGRDYETAADLFMKVSNYEDAEDWVKNSIYMLASELRDEGDFERARSLFTNIVEYQDSAEQAQACAYIPAEQMMKEKQYEEAAALFKEIPGYEDASELYSKCMYQAAKAAVADKSFEKALDLYAEIPEYEDVEKLVLETQYAHADQLATDEKFAEAIEIFESLGEYDDAETRTQKTRYAQAAKAFENSDYEGAKALFEMLGDYTDAAEQVKACTYEIAMVEYEGMELAAAYRTFADIEDYAPATEKAREVAYKLGDSLEIEGDLEGAAEAYANAGEYEDAQDKFNATVYKRAQALKDGGSYQEAGALFDSIITYQDARTMRDDCYDIWLSIRSITAKELYDSEDYEGVIQLLSDDDLDMEAIPKAYENIRSMYYDSNYKLALQLIKEDRALEAYPYLVACQDQNNNAKEHLTKSIYRILGTWETEIGVRYAFYLNGTCNIAGKQQQFNMFNAYGIFTGDSEETLERTLTFSSGTEDSMTLREADSGKVIRLHRKYPAEFEPSDKEEGITVTIEEAPVEGEEGETEEVLPETDDAGDDAGADAQGDAVDDTGTDEDSHG